jgi:hypothetical protein
MKKELTRAMTRIPFIPFTVCLSDGNCYEVKHPENAMLTDSGLYIHLGQDEVIRCSILHVTSVKCAEPTQAA